ncbi:MAG: N-succinylarginine dihydrolase [Pirellulales bacterium]
MSWREVNFDGLVGPSHNYAGLAFGNLASMQNRQNVANPKAAALEGLRKMRLLMEMGIAQAVLPPHPRPDIDLLRRVGFEGNEATVIARSFRTAPELLAASYSGSSMWVANCATVSPSPDSGDGRLHFTPANLTSQLHRSIEWPQTNVFLQAIFPDREQVIVHEALPASPYFADEGAANHTRLCGSYGEPGFEIFVYGRRAGSETRPRKFPARQTLEATQAIARLHRLDPGRTLFLQQDPQLIDAGVFHNDVIAVGNGPLLLYHERAFVDPPAAKAMIERAFAQQSAGEPLLVSVGDDEVSVRDAVETYLFNSQIVTLPDRAMSLVAPVECQENGRVRRWIEGLLVADNPVRSVEFVDVRESMRNGGGPACLRLRVVLSEHELARIHPGVLLDESLYKALVTWVEQFYRDRLEPDDLADPQLPDQIRTALDRLTQILGLGSVYPFQRTKYPMTKEQ